jgi:2-oxo-4-hydroxy-4-carboxy-5-ureidoimidazoline decarboxylase
MNVDTLNAMAPDDACAALLRCCGSRRWAGAMAARRPFASAAELFATADEIWAGLDRADWLEAFAAHPRIGDHRQRLTPLPHTPSPENLFSGEGVWGRGETVAATAEWSAREQAGVAGASDETLRELADDNRRFEERFGHIFIVCATGKTAAEMLRLLRERLPNEPAAELAIAAAEQAKITRLRLEKL